MQAIHRFNKHTLIFATLYDGLPTLFYEFNGSIITKLYY